MMKFWNSVKYHIYVSICVYIFFYSCASTNFNNELSVYKTEFYSKYRITTILISTSTNTIDEIYDMYGLSYITDNQGVINSSSDVLLEAIRFEISDSIDIVEYKGRAYVVCSYLYEDITYSFLNDITVDYAIATDKVRDTMLYCIGLIFLLNLLLLAHSKSCNKNVLKERTKFLSLSNVFTSVFDMLRDGVILLADDVVVYKNILGELFVDNRRIITENETLNNSILKAKEEGYSQIEFIYEKRNIILIIQFCDNYMLLYFNDITKEVSSVNKEKTFFNQASHELRTPLTAIMGLQELMMMFDTNEEERQDMLKMSLEQCERIKLLINAMLDISKNDQMDAYFTSVNINDIITASLKVYHLQMEDRNITLNVTMKEKYIILAHESKIAIIINNLIQNAVKFNVEGGKIDISLFSEDGNIVFKVKDTGIGISEEDLPIIYDVFYRKKTDVAVINERSGVGLTLVKALCSTYRYKVSCESKIDEGSTFTVVFKSNQMI